MQKESRIETVLILQGGGSLGAYECGVFKTLAKNGLILFGALEAFFFPAFRLPNYIWTTSLIDDHFE